mmetsp:Transcript_36659/g.117728  ORF Transcript_36659/g.117728 Transcript_36659/m.117728 type:complete len:397 (+) Transcript_36659:145-1335(+)
MSPMNLLVALFSVGLHPVVRQTLRGLDAKCDGLKPCAACAEGMLALAQLKDAGLLEAASPNAQNKVMRLCADDLAAVERIFSSLPEADTASRTCLLEARLHNDNLDGAVAIIEGCDGGLLPRPRSCVAAMHACVERGRGDLALRVWRQLQSRRIALDASLHSLLLCTAARPPAEQATALPAIAQAMSDAGHAASSEALAAVQQAAAITRDVRVSAPAAQALRILSMAGSRIERTLAIVKPDAVAAGASPLIVGRVREAGLTIVWHRRWRMDEAGAAEWLQVSWGGAAGGTHRRFFQELSSFYASGEVLALLLEGRDAIAVWRRLLGPGDPSVGRRSHPESIRAVYGTNKLANAAHGADSLAAAAREIAFVFGEGAVQPGGGCEEGTLSAKQGVACR